MGSSYFFVCSGENFILAHEYTIVFVSLLLCPLLKGHFAIRTWSSFLAVFSMCMVIYAVTNSFLILHITAFST